MRRSARRLFAAALFLAASHAQGGSTFADSKHGNAESGVTRRADLAPGACEQCHDGHGSRRGIDNGGPFDRTLFAPNDDELCFECHSSASPGRVYPGNVQWAASAHAQSSDMVWPGPDPAPREPSDAGKCINCHDPHGAADAAGTIPSMTRRREESLCVGCHNGSPAPDVNAQFEKEFRHPVSLTKKHNADEAAIETPSCFAATPINNRHAECGDCHNPHIANDDSIPATAPDAARRNFGVSRVTVANGAAGSVPTYNWRAADDPSHARQFEICFKCHSSWTQLPGSSPDLARLTNPNNASYHPIQAEGKNAIAAASFVSGWTWDRLVYCTDCHGSDEPSTRGPHGSANRFLLKRPAPATSALQPMAPSDLCFSCHRHEVYADSAADAATQSASRFNLPARRGHAYHTGSQDVPCYACHATHGAVSQPALIATGRMPGIVIYTQNAGGGSCTPTCHETRTYSANYAR